MSDDDKFDLLAKLIQKLYEVTDTLNAEFSSAGRRFTLDGHLLGSIGEVLAAFSFDLCLDPPSKKGHDARTKDGRKVQIKLTAVDSGIALYDRPDFLIALQLTDEGIETIYNGPGKIVWKNCGKQQKNGQYHISLSKLCHLNASVTDAIPIVRSLPKIRRRQTANSL
jgi:Family of unknown function (DUF6998)